MTDCGAGQTTVGRDSQAPEIEDLVEDDSDTPAIDPYWDELPDPEPKYRALINVVACNRRIPVLADSGCTGCCISTDFFNKNPVLRKTFVPQKSRGRAINGSDVAAIGMVKLEFMVIKVPMQITCKVVKGLIDPIVLGWDWFSKYEVVLNVADGILSFKGALCQIWLKLRRG